MGFLNNKEVIAIKECEIKQLKEQIDKLKEENKNINFEFSCTQRKNELSIAEAINKLRADMNKALIESDLKRVEAVAKLEVYEKIDTKTQVNAISDMLKTAIQGLSTAKVNVIK